MLAVAMTAAIDITWGRRATACAGHLMGKGWKDRRHRWLAASGTVSPNNAAIDGSLFLVSVRLLLQWIRRGVCRSMLLDGLTTELDETVEAIGDIVVGVGARAHLALPRVLIEPKIIQLSLEAGVLGMAVVLAKDLGLEADGIMDEDASSVPLDKMMVGRIAEHAGEVVEKLWHRSLGVRHAHHATGGGTRVIEVSRKEMRRGRSAGREHPGHCRIAAFGGFANATGRQRHQRLHLARRKEGNLAGHGAFLCGYQSK